jgi:hypothetical protein
MSEQLTVLALEKLELALRLGSQDAELSRLKARVEELEMVAAEAHIAGLREGVELARGVQDPVLPDWRADADGRWVDDSDYDWGRQDAADRLRARADELALALKEA